jgi:fumarate reductase flavoprotein subunit
VETHLAQEKIQAQLTILGGGGAGLCASAAALEAGLSSVVVLEKRSALGGNTALATGFFACESPVQARLRIVADKDEMFKRAVRYAHWSRIDPRIIRAYINKTGDTIRWLEEKGIEFDIVPFTVNQHPRIWHCPKGRGARLINVLANDCRTSGATILSNCRAIKIMQDETGRVTGVSAQKGGAAFDIRTQSVLIATGGFGGNKDYLHQRCPLYFTDMPLRGIPHDGDGLAMAEDIGAATGNFVTLLKEGPRMDLNIWPLNNLERSAESVWVNRDGRRFIDECAGDAPFESINAILTQPGKACFTLVDHRIMQQHVRIKPESAKALEKQIKKGRVKKSDRWEEIAGWIGADPEMLIHTVEEYNRFCAQGYDELFAKDRRYLLPLEETPFYAVRNMPTFLDTLGGIVINEKMEVIDQNRTPIPGLYAAGVTASGWVGENYCGDLSGFAFGFALNSGRIAGENAAQFISETQFQGD